MVVVMSMTMLVMMDILMVVPSNGWYDDGGAPVVTMMKTTVLWSNLITLHLAATDVAPLLLLLHHPHLVLGDADDAPLLHHPQVVLSEDAADVVVHVIVHAHPSVGDDNPGVVDVDVVDGGIEGGRPAQEELGLGELKQTSQWHHCAQAHVLSASMLVFLSFFPAVFVE